MKLSVLEALLAKRLNPSVFRDQLALDMAEYLKNADQEGSVMPVRISEDRDIHVSGAHIRTLCELFATAQLSAEELAFIADVLQLSERVAFDEGVADMIAEMTDPEINGPFTVDRAKEIFKSA
jgi:hypothetical protein